MSARGADLHLSLQGAAGARRLVARSERLSRNLPPLDVRDQFRHSVDGLVKGLLKFKDPVEQLDMTSDFEAAKRALGVLKSQAITLGFELFGSLAPYRQQADFCSEALHSPDPETAALRGDRRA